MHKIFRISVKGGAQLTLNATEAAGHWTWSPALDLTQEYVERVEVFRPGEPLPCLVLVTDGDKLNRLARKSGKLSLQLRLLSPAFSDSGVKGLFGFVADLSGKILQGGETLWNRFTSKDSAAPLPQEKTLSELASDAAVRPLGQQSIRNNDLRRELPFFDGVLDPNDHNVVLFLRRATRVGDRNPVFLLGFSPRYRYSAQLEINDVTIAGQHTVAEWVQPAEIVEGALPGGKDAWLLWLRNLGNLHRLWNAAVRVPYAHSLEAVAAGEDATFVPELLDSALGALAIGFRFEYESTRGCNVAARVPLKVEPFSAEAGATIHLQFSGLPLLDAGAPFAYFGTAEDASPQDAEDEIDERFAAWPELLPGGTGMPARAGTRFRIRVTDALSTGFLATELRRTRFGALDLGVAAQGGLKFDALAYATGVQLRDTPGPDPQVRSLSVRVYEMDIADVRPGAEDPVPDTTRTPLDSQARTHPAEQAIREMLTGSASLIIPLDADDRRAAALLEAQEQSSESSSRSLILRLRRKAGAVDPDRSIVYLCREPFIVARIDVPSLVQPDTETDEIANWSLSEKEGRKWEIAAASKGFDLALPPQAVGEAMEKSSAQPFIEDQKAVDFRLSAPARLRLQSTWFQQGYAEAPWNLSRVLGYVGQRAPGARVDRLAFELVYGITTVVDAGQVPFRLSLVEVASKTGDLAPPLERVLIDGRGYARTDARRQVFRSYRARWAQVLGAFRSRLAVLELYAPGDRRQRDGDTQVQTLSLQQGVTAYLRDGRYKLFGDALAAPDKGDGVDLRYPILPSRRPAESYYDKGLAGGFAWPFESDAIFRNLLRDPVSNEARVTGLRFSALGAWGDQRASFDNKRTKIISTTAMGRLSRITVERVGRIGVFWNRSKHVIVYERTVLPTPQFAPTQKKLAGRAILRKVAEYVEILEPERRYPEFGAAPQSRGFVEGIHFATRRILVDGTWGQDTPNGFEIQLWNPESDPRIYPKPSVFLTTSGDKQGVAERVPREISEPDRLIFFSATAPDLDDRTDQWPSFLGVDFDNHPAPQPEQQEALHPHDPDGLLPDVAGDLPGWRRFTWPLAPDGLATNLVSERTRENALNACLTNVSMMRSAAGSLTGPVPAAMAAVDASRSLFSQLQQNAAAVIRSGLPPDSMKARLLRELDAASAALAAMNGSAQQAVATLALALPTADAVASAKARVKSELRQSVERQRALSQARIDEWKKAVITEIQAAGASIPATEFKHMAETWGSQLLVQLSPLKTGYEKLLGALDTLFEDARRQHADALRAFDEAAWPLEDAGMTQQAALQLTDALRAEVLDALAALGSALPAEVPPLLQGALAQLRSAVAGIVRAANAFFDAVDAQILAAGPWLPPMWEQIQDLRQQVFGELDAPYVAGELTLATPVKLLAQARQALDKGMQDVLGAVPDLAQALLGKLRDLAGGDTAKLIDDVLKACDGAYEDLGKFATEALKRAEDDTVLGQFVEGALGWKDKLDDLSKQWLGAQKQFDQWRTALEQQAVGAVEDWARSFEPDLRAAMAAADSFYGRVRSLQEDLGKSPTFQDPTSTLRLIRAVGEGPLLPEMSFNRDRIAYFFDDYAAAVRSSPVAALVNRVGDDLKALGIRLPTQSFLERIIPASLQNFDRSKVLPDFSALKNSGLFERLKMPAIANDTVKVTQGFDEANRMPWLKASVEVPMRERSEVFKLGPLGLVLPKAHFSALAEVRSVGGAPKKTQHASILADWMLEFGGLPLVTFEDTLLAYDEGGKMRFDIRADRIRMDAALQWMTDLMKAYKPDGDSGLKLEMVYDAGRPIGVACTLGAALPPIGAGVFAISGLMLGAGLTLAMDPESNEFAIGVQFNLSRKLTPFTLTIAFLNGGGWVETQARYLTTSRRVVSRVSIGIVAGAGVEFALGPCVGSVYVQFGIFVEFSSGGANGQQLSIGIMLLVRGSAVVFSIATVTITLLLQAVYREDGTLTGYGSLSVSIRVSQFIKLKFRSQVTYKLSGGGGARTQPAAMATHVTPGTRAIAAAARQAQLFQ